MFTVNVEQECGCFRRSGLENGMSFDSKDDALIQAKEMETQMNSDFCQKHQFTAVEAGDSFTIMVGMKPRTESHSGGCCGGGHCS